MFVCTQLSQPDQSGVQTCITWEQQVPLFPDLTAAQWSDIAVAMVTVLATAWVFKTLSTFIKES